jgi:bacillithiol biosynthesis cysteine-adding enzyme BshC
VYDASDPAAKPLVADLFAREIESEGATCRQALETGAALEALGYHAQATPPEGSLAIFHVDGGREAIRVTDTGFTIGGRTESKTALLEHVKRAPGDFSPSVLLRPLAQDTLFPTVCYVAGPSELAYLGQLKNVYSAFGIPMPLIYQRASATLLDSNASRFLARYELPLESLRAQDEAALNALLEATLPRGVESALQEARRTVVDRMTALMREVLQIDATLEGAAKSTLTRMQDDLEKLNAKIIQAAKRKNDTLRRQFHHARAQTVPAGQPQERTVGFIYFLNRYGPTLVERLYQELPLEMGTHWVIS